MKRICMLIYFTILLPLSIVHAEDIGLLQKEVMDIHDVAMAKMTQMHELKLDLQAVAKATGTTPVATKAIDDLQAAHKGMMEWMRAYKAPQSGDDPESVLIYLHQEKIKIEQVNNAIDASIEQAGKLTN